MKTFKNALLINHDKWIEFGDEEYKWGSNMAVLDWNENVDREYTSISNSEDARRPRSRSSHKHFVPKKKQQQKTKTKRCIHFVKQTYWFFLWKVMCYFILWKIFYLDYVSIKSKILIQICKLYLYWYLFISICVHMNSMEFSFTVCFLILETLD